MTACTYADEMTATLHRNTNATKSVKYSAQNKRLFHTHKNTHTDTITRDI